MICKKAKKEVEKQYAEKRAKEEEYETMKYNRVCPRCGSKDIKTPWFTMHSRFTCKQCSFSIGKY